MKPHILFPAMALALLAHGGAGAAEVKPGAAALVPNLAGQLARPLRYRPEGADFVIDNGREFFNRPLYGGNSAFRVDGGDRPEFSLYLPGRGGNVRLGLRTPAGTRWLHEARSIRTRYRPGELHYRIADPLLGPSGRIELTALAYAASEGLGLRLQGHQLARGAELVFAFGPGNGERGRRDGDIGTEQVPIGEFFQFVPEHARGSRIELSASGFRVAGKAASISATVGAAARMRRADAGRWNDLPALLASNEGSVVVGQVALSDRPLYLAFQVSARGKGADLEVYRQAGATGDSAPSAAPAFSPAELAQRFEQARAHLGRVRERVRIDTPDPYLNAAMGALNIAADAVWDEEQGAIMHGAIAWRTKLLGWRGPYALDALGWHERARRNAELWTARQDTAPVPAQLPPADAATSLARNEAGLHSNGDLSRSHYDMNLVFVDALLRHLLWTGDLAYAKTVWPVLQRHLAWERRLFRREFGPRHLPLYEAYAAIWASDDMYYSGGGVAYASAYNAWHNRMAARIAALIGQDPAPYAAEAEAIGQAMREYLWMPERGAFAEYRDLLGRQALHPSYGLWSFYHTLDSSVPTPREAARMADDLDRHARAIPVVGPGVPADRPYRVLPSSDWMPYTWSVNNVVMGEVMHTALGYWQAGRIDTAYELAKGALLASMYMGITPGNVGSMNYLDVYRRESQRDFADGSGVMARALVEGLFGVRPDALARTLTLHPGLPREWRHASLVHPDLALAYRRVELSERWTVTQTGTRFERLDLALPLLGAQVARVRANGKPVAWTIDNARLRVQLPLAARADVRIDWRDAAPAPAQAPVRAQACKASAPAWLQERAVQAQPVDLAGSFNDRVREIFKPGKYLAPRSPYVSLSLPAQGAGAWAGHVGELPRIDDAGLRGTLQLPNGLRFDTPVQPHAPNVMFVSQWDNYPRELRAPLAGRAHRLFLLMAGTTNPMQSRIDNGEVIVTYADGGQERLALRNPETWWPIEQDYFIDDYQFAYCGELPLRVDLKTAEVRLPRPGNGPRIEGGAASVLALPLDPARTLQSVTVRALANDVVIGLLAATLDRAEAHP